MSWELLEISARLFYLPLCGVAVRSSGGSFSLYHLDIDLAGTSFGVRRVQLFEISLALIWTWRVRLLEYGL